MVFITIGVTRRSRVAFVMQHYLGGMNAVMEENIAGIRVVQAFVRADDTVHSLRLRMPPTGVRAPKADIITAT